MDPGADFNPRGALAPQDGVAEAARGLKPAPQGCEWIVEAHRCDSSALCDADALRKLFERLIEGMNLHPVAESQWHQFEGGGITGLALLQESHIACHTFPEYGSLCLNVFCCRPRPDWDFEAQLRQDFGAGSVEVRRLDRPYA